MSAEDALLAALRTIPDFPSPGIQFKDITPILGDPVLLHEAVSRLCAPFREKGITKVIGIEARGFMLGALMAHELNAGFIPVRKKGKLPWRVYQQEYALEYGSDVVEMHRDAIAQGDQVLIHDDVIATGGTAEAASALVREAGGRVAGYAFLTELGFLDGRAVLGTSAPIHSVLVL